MTRLYRRRLVATTALTLACMLWSAGAARAAIYEVATADELADAISQANGNGEDNRIILKGDIALSQLTAQPDGLRFLPPIGNTDGSSGKLEIDLDGHTISGNGVTRVFFANQGELTISNGTIADGLAQGGNGGFGDTGAGGGGMGAGGALYVRSGAHVTVDGVSFADNQAKGGNSGATGSGTLIHGGGGGGLGGNGGDGGAVSVTGGSGGGGGAFVNGNNGFTSSDIRVGGDGGGPNGGTGTSTSNAGSGGDLSGGGGSGGFADESGFNGGVGGYGGGGGGASSANARGGAGGYGGGGGGGGNGNASGGAGGFGGGGGGGYQGPGAGGFGGGNGGSGVNAGGGGGAGFGGAIFVQDGGSLTVTGSGTVSGGGVQGGTGGGGGATNGMARGSGIFLQNAGMTFAPGAGQTQTVNDVIADDTGNGGNEGKLVKDGAGTLVLSAVNTYTGGTTVAAGTLRVTGTVVGLTTVKSNATLDGGGILGSTEIEAGGLHAMGGGLGSQTVKGDYLNRGTFEIAATPTGASRLIVDGTVDIAGATLKLDLSPATHASWDIFHGPFVIIQNDGGDAVEGEFGTIVKNLIFLDPRLSYTGGNGHDVTLELARNQTGFADIGGTRNQAATGNAVETLTNASAVWRALALSASEEEARILLDELSGEMHASLAGMFTQDSRFWRNAANDRLRGAFGSVAATGQQVMGFGATGLANAPADMRGLALWTQGFGAWGKTKSDGNASEFTRNAGGFLAGADLPVGAAVRLGALAGYAHSSFDNDHGSSGDADSYQLGLYGGTRAGAFGLRAGLAYAWHDVDTERHALGDKLTADYDADTLQIFGEAGYAFDLGSLRLEPFANAAYVSTHIDGFEENSGPAALASDSETNDTTFTTLGLRAALGFELGSMPASLRAMAGWRHAFGDIRPETTFAFEGSADFVIAGAPIARDAAVLEAGFDLSITPDATLGLAYSGEIADGAQDHGLNATLAIAF